MGLVEAVATATHVALRFVFFFLKFFFLLCDPSAPPGSCAGVCRAAQKAQTQAYVIRAYQCTLQWEEEGWNSSLPGHLPPPAPAGAG